MDEPTLHGFLLSNSFAPCIAHRMNVLSLSLDALRGERVLMPLKPIEIKNLNFI
jgi:hypothetical protein